MKELEVDPDQMYKSLALKLGISRLTVAKKLRRLFDGGVVKISSWADPVALGYSVTGGFRICAHPGRINEVTDKLASFDHVSHIHLVTGYFDIIAWCQFRDREELSQFLTNDLGTIPALQHVETQLILNQVKMFPRLLTTDQESPQLNSVAHDLDDLDLELIRELQRDARQKPIQIARKLGLSNTTILRRTRRLVNEQIIRKITWINPFALGYYGVAIIALKCDMDNKKEATEALAAYKEVQYIFITTGQYDTWILVVFRNLTDLHHFIDVELRSISGLKDIDSMVIHKIIKTSAPYVF